MPERFWLRHDLHVVAVAAAVLCAAWIFRFEVTAAPTRRVASGPLTAAVPAAWLADPAAGGALTVRGDDAVTRLELRVIERPPGGVPLDGALELERGGRELYQRVESERREIGGKDVLRTVYTYAFKPMPNHAPRVATAIEYAFPVAADDGVPLYVATIHASDDRVRDLERRILGTIEVAR